MLVQITAYLRIDAIYMMTIMQPAITAARLAVPSTAYMRTGMPFDSLLCSPYSAGFIV
jgi:hypothetical protein